MKLGVLEGLLFVTGEDGLTLEDIEKLLEEANNLYKEGKVEASQALFEKISALNKAKNDDKVYVKAA